MTRGVASWQMIASAYVKFWVQSQILKNQTKPKRDQGKEVSGGGGRAEDGGVLGMSAASCPWVSGSTHFHKITNAGSSSSCHLPTGLNVKFQGLNFIPYAREQACQVAGQLIYFCKVQKCFFFIGEQ